MNNNYNIIKKFDEKNKKLEDLVLEYFKIYLDINSDIYD